MNHDLTNEQERYFAEHLMGVQTWALDELLADPDTQDPWLIPGLVTKTSTFVYGPPKAGKSFLVSNIIAGLTAGVPVLGKGPTVSGLGVFIAATDHDGHREYAQRAIPLGADSKLVRAAYIGPSPSDDKWDGILSIMMLDGLKVLVVDTATNAVADEMNSDSSWRDLHKSLDKFITAGIAVILVGHSSDKSSTSTKLMGHTSATGAVRWLVFLGPGESGKSQKLITRGNYAAESQIFVSRDADGRYSETTTPPKRERAEETKTKNDEMFEYAYEHCQGMPKKQVAEALVDAGFSNSVGSLQTSLGGSKPLGKLFVSRGWSWG